MEDFMISLDVEKCNKCGVCIEQFKFYCISSKDEMPVFDYQICNQCQKCISICPHQAISLNGKNPTKITSKLNIKQEDLIELLERRRSCKKFKDILIPRETLIDIANIARYAPNQNKNIDIIVIDNKEIINKIDMLSYDFINRIYRFLILPAKKVTGFLGFKINQLDIIFKKMNLDINIRKKILKDNTQAIYLTIGNPKVSVTKESSPYLLSTMLIYTESLGIGSCLLDSIKLTSNYSKKMQKLLGIPKGLKVLGALSVGYSAEKIFNIPRGYNIKVYFNKFSNEYENISK
jgi:nitroreductase/NAD-dependent dihydropyrimidine dehydrogenase PreA subunit